MKKDIEIAQEATIKPIIDIAATIGLQAEDLEQYGKYKAKSIGQQSRKSRNVPPAS